MKYRVYNKKCLILFLFVFLFLIFIIYSFIFFFRGGMGLDGKKNKYIEGFTWSKQTQHDFLDFQDTINYNTQFNMKMIQEQATEEEARELMKTGSWPWSRDTEYAYMNHVAMSPILNIDPAISMKIQKSVYNERAIQQLLGWNTKEGQFLLNGSIIDNGNGTIQCTTNDEGKTTLQKKVLTGYNSWNGYADYKITDLTNETIPQNVPGFQFVGSPCNPCLALDNDYSCPFQIATKKEGNKISDVWKKLWNL